MVDDRIADAGDLAQFAGGRAQHLGEGAEAGKQRLGDRLGVAARQRLEEDQLDQLVVGQRRAAAFVEALLQPFTVTEIVGLVPIPGGRRAHAPSGKASPCFGETVKIS